MKCCVFVCKLLAIHIFEIALADLVEVECRLRHRLGIELDYQSELRYLLYGRVGGIASIICICTSID